ncbi:DUF2141 domain-containing protein [Kordiimonas marina]|uniref:DUF2141 domain-containing protein n=1 Tax=Kordiimonas marina TaxID=2872312 RepID=UPI001FF552B4|nr:DUF2141 domain-containing protein [Kordiimonas marina]
MDFLKKTVLAKLAAAGALAAFVSAPSYAALKDCKSKPESWLEVNVTGFKDRTGDVSVELHPDIEGDYLDKLVGRVRIETPSSDPTVCVPLPEAGKKYILVVLHDRDKNNKLNVLSDGFGFSNNPKIGMGTPAREKTAFTAKKGENKMTVILNYVQGLTARPLSEDEVARDQKRRRVRR